MTGSHAPGAAPTRPPPLFEREVFLDDLRRLFLAATQGHGRVALVHGEAGIGKTALVRGFVQRHVKAPSRALFGACDALFTPRPLGPLHDIASHVGGALGTRLAGTAPREGIFGAVLEELRDPRGATVLVVEDVHWADEATLDLLKFVGRRIDRTRGLLVLTFRDEEAGPRHPVRFVLGDLPPESVLRLALPPLSEGAVAALAAAAGRRSDGLHAATGGNPFYVTEVLATDASGVPPTVRDAVLARAARLTPSARRVLELASAAPAPLARALIQEATPARLEDVEECLEAGVLVLAGDEVAFRHELARRAVLDSLPALERRRLHERLLRALLTRTPAAPAARLAHHAEGAGDAEAVLRFAVLAGDQATTVGAHREAAAHLDAALRHAARLPDEERARLLERRSYECYLTDQLAAALGAREEALGIWQALGSAEKAGGTLRWMSRLLWFLGRNAEARRHAEDAVVALEQLPPGRERAMAYSNRSQLHMLSGEVEEARDWGSRAIALARELGDQETEIHALNNVGTAELLAGIAAGQEKLEESLRLALAGGFQEHAARAFTNLASGNVAERRYEAGHRFLEDGIQYATDHDLDSWRLYMLAWRARFRLERGDWAGAAADATAVVEYHGASPVSLIPALAALGLVRARRGDPGAVAVLDRARELAWPTGEAQRIVPVAAARAERAWLSGDPATARTEAEAARAQAGSRSGWESGLIALWLWRGGAPAKTEGLPEPIALEMRGEWCAAAAAWEAIGCPYEAALARAEASDEVGLRAALAVLELLEAGPAVARVRARLQSLGLRVPRGPRRSTRESPAGLTAREQEVLRCLEDGLGNAAIADRLGVAQKTIDHHVSAVLGKLGVRSRGQAVAEARRRGLLP